MVRSTSLAEQLVHRFDGTSRLRAVDYLGRVQIEIGNATRIEALVQGSEREPYRVLLSREGAGFRISCSCRAYADRGPCKHLWAVIVTADIKSLMRSSVRATEDARVAEARPRGSSKPSAKPPALWEQQLATLKTVEKKRPASWPQSRQIVYLLKRTHPTDPVLHLDVGFRDRKKDGELGKPMRRGVDAPLESLGGDDAAVLAVLQGPELDRYSSRLSSFEISEALWPFLLSRICTTGRCFLWDGQKADLSTPLAWNGEVWQFWLDGREEQGYLLSGSLRRGEERIRLQQAVYLGAGVIAVGHEAFRVDDWQNPWLKTLHSHELRVPLAGRSKLLEALYRIAHPHADLPRALELEEVVTVPMPRFVMRKHPNVWQETKLVGDLSFDYGGLVVPGSGDRLLELQADRVLIRDALAESAARLTLEQLGLKCHDFYDYDADEGIAGWEIPRNRAGEIARALLAQGFFVQAEGKIFVTASRFDVRVSTGIDWFELHGDVAFGEHVVHLPALLRALRKGERLIDLGDGTFGMLPDEWLKKMAPLGAFGTPTGDHVRFGKAQVGLLDALLAERGDVSCDELFARARDELNRFQGISPLEAPDGFHGTLRDYQKDGLGWFEFLRTFGFGGCLADDMGLGKTIQVLALLEARRMPGRVSLVVAPRSLIWNWKEEARRFTPEVRILDHTGIERPKDTASLASQDLVLTTYGTLRRDIHWLRAVPFDYVILDEAQSIKTAGSESAKAARLLTGAHRLALSGTPIENHVGELWSLFEFLNPGMMGSSSAFKLIASNVRAPEKATRELIARLVKPFLLRRTKEQVVTELPAKQEQTVYCELEPQQQRHYDELREYYKDRLLGRIDREGMGKSQIQILEALLRLRQAACHSGLIDKKRTDEPSAKMEALVEKLRETRDEGHKALVFSQFTSMLAIVKKRLIEEGITFEYLDGKTRDRAACVERFQSDPNCDVFLISLKAGGIGLNLTAAEYVFLLDPWWNPAVEAQAVDRSHRIGQTRPVFAYRLIARGTVEEKVLELQAQKRALVKDLLDVNLDEGLVRSLGRQDLEMLLS